jgi:hypothetical protein
MKFFWVLSALARASCSFSFTNRMVMLLAYCNAIEAGVGPLAALDKSNNGEKIINKFAAFPLSDGCK